MQPLPPDQVPWEQLGEASNPGLAYIASLDAQIAHARAQDPPVGVILQSYHFPRWANGTAEVVSGRFSVEDFEFETAQRVSAEAIAAHDFDAPRKLLVFRLPPFEQMGPDGWWGRWVRFLYERYMGHGWGLVLDLLNEPNNQWWPQRGPDSAVRYCARMMQAAQEIAAEHGHPSPLGAPGLADIVGPTGDLLGNYSDFVPALLSELDGIGFAAHPQFIWTHHNYIDMEADPGDHSPEGPSRATEVREMLAGRWSGWRGTDPDVPGVWLTEGGVRVNRLLARARAPDPEAALELQAELIRRNWDRHDVHRPRLRLGAARAARSGHDATGLRNLAPAPLSGLRPMGQEGGHRWQRRRATDLAYAPSARSNQPPPGRRGPARGLCKAPGSAQQPVEGHSRRTWRPAKTS
jgi:hypothetical protein